MRIKNSLNNIIFGLGSQLISTVLAFIVRTMFIRILGSEYLGVNGLFSNVLSLLSLANLGFGTAIVYSLYKPIKEDNKQEIKAYMNIYSKVYKVIGIFIFIIGILLIPFIPYIIKGEVNIKENLNLIYILFLIDTSVSYFYSYKQSLLIANQQNYVISKIHSMCIILTNIVQCIFLILFKEYMIVLLIQIGFRIYENIIISNDVDKKFKYLSDKSVSSNLSNEKKKVLFKNVYSMFLYKISGTIINSTDNIVISWFVGLNYVGIYSNYLLIISTIKTFLGYIFSSITASVGNLIASNEEDKKEFIFNEIFFLSFWIYGVSSILLYMLINNFILLWLGKQYVLSEFTIIILIIDFYTSGMQNAATTYRDTTGLFGVGKYRPIIAAIINLAVSVILAPSLGISGVLLGTIISRFCVYFWFDPYVIHKYVFLKSVNVYFLDYIVKTLTVIIALIITSIVSKLINIEILYIKFMSDIVFSIFIPNIMFYSIFRNNKYFKYIRNIIISLYKNKGINIANIS